MTTIWKAALTSDESIVHLPKGATFLHVDLDPNEVPCVWAKVTPSAEVVPYQLYVVGTGSPIPDNAGEHLGSLVIGRVVVHVFAAA